MFETVEEALAHYDSTRTQNKRALTIHSQVRQVYHFKDFLEKNCVDLATASLSSKRNYVFNSFKLFK